MLLPRCASQRISLELCTNSLPSCHPCLQVTGALSLPSVLECVNSALGAFSELPEVTQLLSQREESSEQAS